MTGRTNDQITRRSYAALARSRAAGRILRLVCYLFGAVAGGVFAPIWLALLFLGGVLVAEFAESRIVQQILTGESDVTSQERDAKLVGRFTISLLITEGAVAVTLGAIWIFTAAQSPILPFALFMIPVIAIIQTGHRVAGMMVVRLAIYLGVLIAVIVRDLVISGDISAMLAGYTLTPVLLLTGATLAVARSRGRAYRIRLQRETDLAEARDHAAGELEAKSRFVATVSHELRTSLNGVLGMAQTLLATDLNPRQRHQAEVIAESGRSLNTLLNDILDYSKLEVGKLTIECRPEDLRQSVEHIAWLHGAVASEKGLELNVEVAQGVPAELMIDAVRVRQCLSNLVSNAIKFTGNGSVEVCVSSEKCAIAKDGTPTYLITAIVADTGIGIPADRAKHLFQPFAQADGSITRRFGGTGLGLSITRQLVESMGGTVTFESTPGEGTTFRMSFRADGAPALPEKKAGPPVSDVPEASDKLQDGVPGDSNVLKNIRVLVADDIATNRVVMRLFLTPLGVIVEEAQDGEAALAALNEGSFDAAVLDINMPGVDGDDLAKRLRATGADIALVAMSADSSASRVPIGEAGFDGILTKPIDRDKLRVVLTSALDGRAERRCAKMLESPDLEKDDTARQA